MFQFKCTGGSLTETVLVISKTQSGVKGSICGFSQSTQVTCTAQAQNSLGFGTAVAGYITTDATGTR